MNWHWLHFSQLSAAQLYAVLAARQQVFVLEQQCLYPDIDGLDLDAHHLLGYRDDPAGRAASANAAAGPQLCAYLRCLAPGVKFAEASLGRVLTTQAGRGTGAGRALLARGIEHASALYPHNGLRISAQQHLEKFYASFGFATVSAPYDEDGIAHVDMRR
jgi:ElaA protein